MPERSLADKLEQAVAAVVAGRAGDIASLDARLAPLVEVARDLCALPRAGFKARLKSDLQRRSSMAIEQIDRPAYMRTGFHTVTPYLVASDAPGLIEFVKRAVGGEETYRTAGTAGGVHAHVRVGDCMLMIGGGGGGASWRGESRPTALHVYVPDVDAVHARALEAGGIELEPPADRPYGERSGGIKDAAGNFWYLATAKGETYIPKGLRAVNPYLHPLRAEPLIQFMERGFGAVEEARYASPDGVIHHAQVRIGDSVVEMGEANGPYQPMPSTFYLYVPDVDELYRRAVDAGGTSISEPANLPYGDRCGAVSDPFGNHWYIATQL
jgi:PhnB protein